MDYFRPALHFAPHGGLVQARVALVAVPVECAEQPRREHLQRQFVEGPNHGLEEDLDPQFTHAVSLYEDVVAVVGAVGGGGGPGLRAGARQPTHVFDQVAACVGDAKRVEGREAKRLQKRDV
eukprot:6199528-Pleurochrysis_carterae.AAC.1